MTSPTPSEGLDLTDAKAVRRILRNRKNAGLPRPRSISDLQKQNLLEALLSALRERDQLRAENAELRGQVDKAVELASTSPEHWPKVLELIGSKAAEIERLATENAELREAVRVKAIRSVVRPFAPFESGEETSDAAQPGEEG